MKKFKLKDGLELPAIGFGTWKLKGEKALESVEHALLTGYRHIDTADYYKNHSEVGKAIKNSRVPRKDIFVTTKVWLSDLHKRDVISAAERFMDELKTDYIDLLLIHWPNRSISLDETLEGFTELRERGLIKSVGVSNFTIELLKKALDTGVEITTNQVEFHPSLNQKGLKEFCDEKNIQLIAYSPLAQGKDLNLEVVKKVSDKVGKTPAQIILKWLIQKGIAVIPRSSSPDHIEENFNISEWHLSEKDMEKLGSVGKKRRLLNPGFVRFASWFLN